MWKMPSPAVLNAPHGESGSVDAGCIDVQGVETQLDQQDLPCTTHGQVYRAQWRLLLLAHIQLTTGAGV